jgi:hypothetical protein
MPAALQDAVLVHASTKDDSMDHVRDLVRLYTQYLQDVGCEVGSFQDLDVELAQLPGRYAPESRGCLLVLYTANSQNLKSAFCRSNCASYPPTHLCRPRLCACFSLNLNVGF